MNENEGETGSQNTGILPSPIFAGVTSGKLVHITRSRFLGFLFVIGGTDLENI